MSNPIWDTKGWLPKIIDETAIDADITTADAGYEISVICDATTGNITSNLYDPTGTNPASIRFRKADNTSYTYTLLPSAGYTIAGYPSGIVLTKQFQYVEINYNGDDNTAQWNISNTNLGLQTLISTPTANDFVSVDNTGQVLDSGISLSISSATNTDTQILSSKATQSAIANAITSGKSFRGGYDASVNLFPSIGGSGTAGAIVAGDFWSVTTAGVINSQPVNVGTVILALVDTPAQNPLSWTINTTGVESFNGRTGIVMPQTNDYVFNQISGTASITQGGTGATTQQAAINALAGSTISGQYLRGNGTNVTMSAIQSSDVPTLNQNTTGSAGSISANNVITNANLVNSSITIAGNNTALGSSVTQDQITGLSTTGLIKRTGANTLTIATSSDYQTPVATPTAGDIVTTDATGQTTDSAKTFGNDGTNATVPTSAQMQSYVIQQFVNLPNLGAVPFATTINDSLSGLAARDGYTPTAGDIALVKNQTNSANNGFWVTTSGAWTRAYFNTSTNAFAAITTQTTYADLNINSGIVNVLNGTVNRNLQYQITITNPAATFGNTTVIVTATTKIPVVSPTNVFVDATIGNNTNNNGSQSFPVATLTQALIVATTTPAIINLMSNSTFNDALTFTNAKTNLTFQGNNFSDNGGLQTIGAQQTFGSGSSYVHWLNTYHSTGSTAPFSFLSGALCRNEFKNITINSTATDWLGLNAGVSNYIRLDNITFQTAGINAINLPAFTNAFTIYVDQQDIFKGAILFTGTGAANTNVVIDVKVADGLVRLPSTYVGNITWGTNAFGAILGSSAHPVGLITSQSDLTAVLAWTTDTTYDGYYAITGFTPNANNFSRGAIFGKQTIGGVATNLWWARNSLYAPAAVKDATTTYTFNYSTLTWTAIGSGGGSGTVTSVSVTSANGLSGTVANATTTPSITLSTNVTGVLKGNGTAISAATSGTDYSAGTSALATGILKSTTTTGALTIAVAADFPILNQNTTGSAASVSGTNVITNANLTQIGAYTIKGNDTNAISNVADLSADQTLDALNNGTSTTNALAINRGGTNTRTQTSNGVNYFDGTKITSNANFTNDGNGNLVVGGNSQILGQGDGTSNTYPVVLRTANTAGTNVFGSGLIIQGGSGSGTGNGGSIKLQTAVSNLPVFLGSYSQVSASTTLFTFSYTSPSNGVNKVLILEIVYGSNTAADASSITYNGTALTQLTTLQNATLGTRTSIWYLASPAAGNGSVIITIPVAATISANVLCFANVNQLNPFGLSTVSTTSASAAPSLAVTTTTSDLALDFLTTANTTTLTSFGTGQSTVNTNTNASSAVNTYSSIKTGASSSTTTSATLGASVNLSYTVCTLKGFVPTPVNTGYITQTATNVTTTSFNYSTLAIYKNQAIVLQLVYTTNAAADASSITYGNQSFISLGSKVNASFVRTSVWYLANPTNGNQSITITLPATASMLIIASSYANVDQANPIYNYNSVTGSTTPAALTITTAANDLAVDLFAIANNTNATVGSGEINLVSTANGTTNIYSSSKNANTTTTALSYSFTGTQNYTYVGYAVKAYTAINYNQLQDNLIVSSNGTVNVVNNLTANNVIISNTINPINVINTPINVKLSNNSTGVQTFTGTVSANSGENIFLPDVTTLSIGQKYKLINNANVALQIISANGSVVDILKANTWADYQVASSSNNSNAGWYSDGTLNSMSNNFISNMIGVATSGTTYVMTYQSPQTIVFTGSTNQVVQLPLAYTVYASTSYKIINNSTAILTIQDGSGAAIYYLVRGAVLYCTCTNSGGTAGIWYLEPKNESNSLVDASGTTVQNIPTNAETTVTIYTAVVQDYLSQWNGSTGTFTASNAGLYQVRFGFGFVANGTGLRYAELYKNNGNTLTITSMTNPSASLTTEIYGVADVYCNANDTVQVRVAQTSGSTLASGTNGYVNRIQIAKLSS